MTIQAQILGLIRELQARTGTALLLITHDLAVVAETVETIAVMYAGRIVKTGTVEQVLLSPQHPYTQGLISSIPGVKSAARRSPSSRAGAQPVPNAGRMPVPAALSVRVGTLQPGGAAAAGDHQRGDFALLPARPRRGRPEDRLREDGRRNS